MIVNKTISFALTCPEPETIVFCTGYFFLLSRRAEDDREEYDEQNTHAYNNGSHEKHRLRVSQVAQM